MCYFKCKRCNNSIAVYADIFAMAKGNVNANYCNPAGYIHETLTVQKTIENALRLVDRPSTDFSWFPGYSWQIAVCSKCSIHVGWKFSSVVKHLKPKSFFGLSNKSLIVWPEKVEDKEEYHDVVEYSNSSDAASLFGTDN
jgi:cereblon